MAIIGFEGFAGSGEIAEIPDGYRRLDWTNFYAIDDAARQNTGFVEAIHSGEAAGFNGFEKPGAFKSPNRDDNFDLNSGFFAAAFYDNLLVKVVGFDDGEKVAQKTFAIDPVEKFVTFGPEFDNIDKVRFTARGGTDADPNDGYIGTAFAMDDLFIAF